MSRNSFSFSRSSSSTTDSSQLRIHSPTPLPLSSSSSSSSSPLSSKFFSSLSSPPKSPKSPRSPRSMSNSNSTTMSDQESLDEEPVYFPYSPPSTFSSQPQRSSFLDMDIDIDIDMEVDYFTQEEEEDLVSSPYETSSPTSSLFTSLPLIHPSAIPSLLSFSGSQLLLDIDPSSLPEASRPAPSPPTQSQSPRSFNSLPNKRDRRRVRNRDRESRPQHMSLRIKNPERVGLWTIWEDGMREREDVDVDDGVDDSFLMEVDSGVGIVGSAFGGGENVGLGFGLGGWDITPTRPSFPSSIASLLSESETEEEADGYNMEMDKKMGTSTTPDLECSGISTTPSETDLESPVHEMSSMDLERMMMIASTSSSSASSASLGRGGPGLRDSGSTLWEFEDALSGPRTPLKYRFGEEAESTYQPLSTSPTTSSSSLPSTNENDSPLLSPTLLFPDPPKRPTTPSSRTRPPPLDLVPQSKAKSSALPVLGSPCSPTQPLRISTLSLLPPAEIITSSSSSTSLLGNDNNVSRFSSDSATSNQSSASTISSSSAWSPETPRLSSSSDAFFSPKAHRASIGEEARLLEAFESLVESCEEDVEGYLIRATLPPRMKSSGTAGGRRSSSPTRMIRTSSRRGDPRTRTKLPCSLLNLPTSPTPTDPLPPVPPLPEQYRKSPPRTPDTSRFVNMQDKGILRAPPGKLRPNPVTPQHSVPKSCAALQAVTGMMLPVPSPKEGNDNNETGVTNTTSSPPTGIYRVNFQVEIRAGEAGSSSTSRGKKGSVASTTSSMGGSIRSGSTSGSRGLPSRSSLPKEWIKSS